MGVILGLYWDHIERMENGNYYLGVRDSGLELRDSLHYKHPCLQTFPRTKFLMSIVSQPNA